MRRILKVILSIFFAIILFIIAGISLWFLSPMPIVLGGDDVSIEKNLSKNASFKIAFSSKMNKKSVEEAFLIEPNIKGKFFWINDNEFEFKPNENLKMNSKITVSISKNAKNWLGRNLQTKYTQTYIISGSPQLILISPISTAEWKKINNQNIDDTLEEENYPLLKKGEKITFMFDRPMRISEFYDKNSDQQEAFSPMDFLEISPNIDGEYRWLGLSSFEFIPYAEKLPLGKTFEAKLKSGFPCADGGKTETEYIWHFETAEPRIIKTTPSDSEMFVDANNKILIEWNQPINLDTLIPNQNLIISPELSKEAGQRIRVQANKDNLSIVEISFGPYAEEDAFPLPKNTEITINIKSGIKSLYGTKSSFDDYIFSFKTLNDAILEDYSPKNNEQIFSDDKLKLTFSSPVDIGKIKESLIFEPEISTEDIIVTKEQVENLLENIDYVSGEAQREDYLEEELNHIYSVSIPLLPNKTIQWSLKDDLQDEFDRVVEQSLSSSFKTKNYKPEMKFISKDVNRMLFDDSEPVNIFIKSININNANFKICQIPEDKIAELEIGWGWWDYYCPNNANTKRWTEKLNYKDNEWVITEIPLHKKANLVDGNIWFLELTSNEYISEQENKPIRLYQSLFLSSANLVAKSSDKKVLFWATDFLNGQFVEKMKIRVFGENNEEIMSGLTNKEGFFEFSKPESWMRFFAIGENDFLKTHIGSDWDEGISAWDFNLAYDWREAPYHLGYIYTDRLTYKPNQVVNFKGIIRLDNDALLSLPKTKDVNVIIENPFGIEVLNKNLTLNDFGTFSDNFLLNEQAEKGQYSLIVKIKDEKEDWFHSSFYVEDYKKSNLQISLNSSKNFFTQGENFEVDVQLARYFDNFVSDADIEWFIVANEYHFDKTDSDFYFKENNYSKDDCHLKDQLIDKGTGKTDENGIFNINFPINLQNKSPQIFTLIAKAKDTITKEETMNSAIFEIYPAEILVGIKSEEIFFENNSDIEFEIIAVSPTGIGVAKEDVKVSLYNVNDYSKEVIFLEEKEVKTGNNSKMKVKFKVDQKNQNYYGEIMAVAEIIDKNKNTAKASAKVFVLSEDINRWQNDDTNRIEIITDKKSYQIGDIAKLLIKSPFKNSVKAIVTIERKEIINSYITDIKNGQLLEIPVDENMFPNVFVSVVLIKEKGFVDKIISIENRIEEIKNALPEIDKEINNLKTEIENTKNELDKLPEVQELGSIEKVTEANIGSEKFRILRAKLKNLNYELENKNNEKASMNIESRALQSELIIMAKNIDEKTIKEAKEKNDISENNPQPEIKIGFAQISVDTKANGLNIEIITQKEEYLPNEEMTIYLKVRDYKGNPVKDVELSLAIIDDYSSNLTPENIENVFWKNRGLGVSTSASLAYFHNKIDTDNQKNKIEECEISDELIKNIKIAELQDTLYWMPEILTDENGEAEIKLTLPDKLKKWQISSVATTKESSFGFSNKQFSTKKQVLLKPFLPKFAVNGDYFASPVVIDNQTDKNLELSIFLEAENYEIGSMSSVQKIFINSNSQRLINFEGKIKSTEDNNGNFQPAKFKFLVENLDKSITDEVEIIMPVLKQATSESIAISGFLENNKIEFINIPSVVIDGAGELILTLSVLKTGDLKKAIENLDLYPYKSAEQIMSNVLIKIASKKLENNFEINLSDNDQELAEFIENSIQKIYQFQKIDGSFGFWQDSKQGYPELTSYILFGFDKIKNAGFEVDDFVLQNTIDYLSTSLNYPDENIWTKNTMAFAVFALSEIKEFDIFIGDKLYEQSDELSLFGKTSLLLAFDNFSKRNLKNAENKKEALLKEIESSANKSSKGIFFEEESNDPFSANSSIRTTALVFFAMTRINPSNNLIPKMVEYLQNAKLQNYAESYWQNTQNLSWVLMSYFQWIENTEQSISNFNVQVFLNNEVFGQKSWNSSNYFSSESLIKKITKLNKGGQLNEISFKSEGKRNLFYDIIVNYFVPIDKIVEKNQEIGIVRNLYALEDKQFENPLLNTKKGNILKAKINILIPEEKYFLIADIPIPAGFEIINFEEYSCVDYGYSFVEANCNQFECWHWCDNKEYFNHKEFKDDRVLLFADWIPSGTYEYYFLLRAVNEGGFQFLPAKIDQMYHADFYGNTSGLWFEIMP